MKLIETWVPVLFLFVLGFLFCYLEEDWLADLNFEEQQRMKRWAIVFSNGHHQKISHNVTHGFVEIPPKAHSCLHWLSRLCSFS